jgi:hypothetical protein
MPYLTNLDRVPVSGQYVMMEAGQDSDNFGAPAVGTVTFTPSTVLYDAETKEIVLPRPFVVSLDSEGAFEVYLPATDDPDLSPQGWTYRVEETVWGRLVRPAWYLSVPIDQKETGISLVDVAPAPTIGPNAPDGAGASYALLVQYSTEAGIARTEAVAARDIAETASIGAAAARDSVQALSSRTGLATRSALAPLLSPYNPGNDQSGPVAVWLADSYVPGTAGGPGRYSNLAATGSELDAVEASTVTARPRHLPFNGDKYIHVPQVAGNLISTPYDPAFDIAGDIDLRAEAEVTDSGTGRVLIGRNVGYIFRVSANNALTLILWDEGGTGIAVNSSVVPPTGRWHLRATWRQSDGRVQFFTSPTGADGSWTQLGTDQTIVMLNLSPAPNALTVLSRGVGSAENATGYRVEVRSGIDGPVVASWRARDMGQTGGMSGGRQWTIARVAGNAPKIAVVDRPVALFDGVDDFLEVPDDPRLDADVAGFTVVHLLRLWSSGTARALIAKKGVAGSTSAGWMISTGTTNAMIPDYRISNGTTQTFIVGVEAAPGLTTLVGRTTAGVNRMVVNGTPGANSAAGVVAPAPLPFRIGANSNAGAASPQEWLGTFIFRRSVSDDEITRLSSLLLNRGLAIGTGGGGTPTPGSSLTLSTHSPAGSAVQLALTPGGESHHRIVLSANLTLTVTGATDGVPSVAVLLVDSGNGGHSITWPAAVRWPNGVAPALSSGPDRRDVIMLTTYDGGATIRGIVVGVDFRAP